MVPSDTSQATGSSRIHYQECPSDRCLRLRGEAPQGRRFMNYDMCSPEHHSIFYINGVSSRFPPPTPPSFPSLFTPSQNQRLLSSLLSTMVHVSTMRAPKRPYPSFTFVLTHESYPTYAPTFDVAYIRPYKRFKTCRAMDLEDPLMD
ncbi:hypothetical protein PILCRDRAFT_682491 [Piloderma croceum F 1598]|uniref:Uncharacterized protein n=1 Tax=Piloderma croceum (strain F 1598) TaxID=765440 RepID=A0A0C3ERN2_PILCF|nr:hypothetical protein PILCRDRAFT_682491 [Piloderma croceum F 1598]